MSVNIDVEGCPCVDATFAEGPLAPGLPRIIEITAGAQAPGEWLGSINITARSTAPGTGTGTGTRDATQPGDDDDDDFGVGGGGDYVPGTTAGADEYVYYEDAYEETLSPRGGDGRREGGGGGGGVGAHAGGHAGGDRHHYGGGGAGGTPRVPPGFEEGVHGGYTSRTDEQAEEVVYVPLYLSCVAKEREIVTRAGATVGISGGGKSRDAGRILVFFFWFFLPFLEKGFVGG